MDSREGRFAGEESELSRRKDAESVRVLRRLAMRAGGGRVLFTNLNGYRPFNGRERRVRRVIETVFLWSID